MSNQLTATNDRLRQGQPKKHSTHEGSMRINWLAKLPHLFKTKIFLGKAEKQPQAAQPAKPNWVMLIRKTGKKQNGFIRIEKMADGNIKFHCDKTDKEWITQSVLLISILVTPKIANGSEWVVVHIPDREDIVVNRLQLIEALRFFKVLARA